MVTHEISSALHVSGEVSCNLTLVHHRNMQVLYQRFTPRDGQNTLINVFKNGEGVVKKNFVAGHYCSKNMALWISLCHIYLQLNQPCFKVWCLLGSPRWFQLFWGVVAVVWYLEWSFVFYFIWVFQPLICGEKQHPSTGPPLAEQEDLAEEVS